MKRTQNVGGDDHVWLGDFEKVYKTSVGEAQRRMALDPRIASDAIGVQAAGTRPPVRERPTPRGPIGGPLTMTLDDGSGAHPSRFPVSMAEAQMRAALLPTAKEEASSGTKWAGGSPVKVPDRGLRVTRPVGGHTSFQTADLAPQGGQDRTGAEYTRPTTFGGEQSRTVHSYESLQARKLCRDDRLGGKSAAILDGVDPHTDGITEAFQRKPQPVGGWGPAHHSVDLVTETSKPGVLRPGSRSTALW